MGGIEPLALVAVGSPFGQMPLWLTLVEPFLRSIQIRDSVAQVCGEEPPVVRECFLVADDREGYELNLEPSSNDFVLAYSGDPTRGDRGFRCYL